ncbi:MAG: PorT family protein [Saprospiraceae bacterium]|nr:PorT family protein [Saprospiraceae bacterium]
MKQYFFALGFFLMAAASVHAQVTLRPQIGINASSLSTDLDSLTYNSNVGFQLGGDLVFGNKFYVQPGVMFEYLSNPIDPRTGEEQDFKRSYLRIPVMVGYNFAGAEKSFGFRVFTGPNASFNLSSKTDNQDIEEYVKSTIWGWNAGLGLDISILFVDLGYQFGLSEVFENFDEGARNNLFYANAGVRIRF